MFTSGSTHPIPWALLPQFHRLVDNADSRLRAPMQPSCNTVVEPTPVVRTTSPPPARRLRRALNGNRKRTTLELPLHVCCTQADLVTFGDRSSASSDARTPRNQRVPACPLKITIGREHNTWGLVLTSGTK